MEQIKYYHEPNISESLGNGWHMMKKYFLWLFVAIIVNGIANGPTKFTFDSDFHFITGAILMVFIGIAFILLIQPVIKYGVAMMFVQASREQEPDLRLLIKGFQNNYFNIVLANLLKMAIVGIGFACLIIPGIILACRLAFVPYLVMDKDLDPIKAIEESWKMTKGYGWTIFGLALTSFFIFILGLICLIVGVFPAIIWINSSFASLYQAILINNGTRIEK